MTETDSVGETQQGFVCLFLLFSGCVPWHSQPRPRPLARRARPPLASRASVRPPAHPARERQKVELALRAQRERKNPTPHTKELPHLPPPRLPRSPPLPRRLRLVRTSRDHGGAGLNLPETRSASRERAVTACKPREGSPRETGTAIMSAPLLMLN